MSLSHKISVCYLGGATPADMPPLDVSQVNLYERMGETVLKDIATAFYDRVYADKHELSTSGESIRGVFANTTKADAIDSHFRFLVERLGGPSLYTSTKGAFQLIGRHAPYAGVNEESGERWLFHMVRCLQCAPLSSEAAVSDVAALLCGARPVLSSRRTPYFHLRV